MVKQCRECGKEYETTGKRGRPPVKCEYCRQKDRKEQENGNL